jgi:hypothetical protein
MDQKFGKIAEVVAKEMGDWEISPGYNRDQFVIEQGEQSLYLAFDIYGNVGKVEISAQYPERARELYRVKRPEIRVSHSRGAGVIAKEIKRRLMPEYLPELAKVQQRIKEVEEAEAVQAIATKAVATALGVNPPGEDKYQGANGIYVRTGSDYSSALRNTSFRMYSSGSTHIEIYTDSTEVAIKIAEFIRTLK